MNSLNKTLINNSDNNNNFFIICHHCKKLINQNEIINCTGMNCGENYCFTCLKNIYYKNKDIKEIIEESKENGWICFKCQNKCLCNKCKFKKEKFIDNVVIEIPSQNNEENNNINSIPFNNDAILIQTLSKGYKPVIDISKLKFPNISNITNVNKKLKNKLIKVAKLCEHYYRHKCKTVIFHKECLICHENEFHTNELLRFKNSDDFLNYLRYCILLTENTICYDRNIYNKNKKIIMEYYKEYEENIMDWEFHIPKTICKLCLLKMFNNCNVLLKCKTILIDDFTKEIENKNDLVYSKIKEKKSVKNKNKNNNNDKYNIILRKNIININRDCDIQKNKSKEYIFKYDNYLEIKQLYENLIKLINDFYNIVNFFINNKYIILLYLNKINRIEYQSTIKNLNMKYKNIIEIEKKLHLILIEHKNKIDTLIISLYNSNVNFYPKNLIDLCVTLKIENNLIFKNLIEIINIFNNYAEYFLKRIENI